MTDQASIIINNVIINVIIIIIMTNAINITNFHWRKPRCKSFVEAGELLVSSSIIIRSGDICQ